MEEKIEKEDNREKYTVLPLYHSFDDQPSCYVKSNGTYLWHKNGKRHRTKGPAVICNNGLVLWFYDDNDVTDKVNQLMKEEKISSDWENWIEEDEFLFILLVS